MGTETFPTKSRQKTSLPWISRAHQKIHALQNEEIMISNGYRKLA